MSYHINYNISWFIEILYEAENIGLRFVNENYLTVFREFYYQFGY